MQGNQEVLGRIYDILFPWNPSLCLVMLSGTINWELYYLLTVSVNYELYLSNRTSKFHTFKASHMCLCKTVHHYCRYVYFPSPCKLLYVSYNTSLFTATNQKGNIDFMSSNVLVLNLSKKGKNFHNKRYIFSEKFLPHIISGPFTEWWWCHSQHFIWSPHWKVQI